MGILRFSQQLHPVRRDCSHPALQIRLRKGSAEVDEKPASSGPRRPHPACTVGRCTLTVTAT